MGCFDFDVVMGISIGGLIVFFVFFGIEDLIMYIDSIYWYIDCKFVILCDMFFFLFWCEFFYDNLIMCECVYGEVNESLVCGVVSVYDEGCLLLIGMINIDLG